jgi:hypothetical protein
MKKSRPFVLFFFFLGLIFLVGILLWQFVLANIIEPLALVLWLLLRIFVLSIDQKIYWGALIFLVLFFFFRHFSNETITSDSYEAPDKNAILKNIAIWHSLFNFNTHGADELHFLKRELVQLLVSMIASQGRVSTNIEVYDALKHRQIAIPEHIYISLFADKPAKPGRSLKKILRAIRFAPKNWIHKWTGRAAVEHYQMIDEVLAFMETSLEINNDTEKFDPRNH